MPEVHPLFCVLMFREPSPEAGESAAAGAHYGDPYGGVAYRLYRGLLRVCLRFRWATMALMTAALVAAVMGFGQVKNAFFPASSLPMFMVDYWLPQGSDIGAVETDIEQLEQELLALPGVRHVTATIGRGAERFMLTYAPELSYPSYAQLIVEVDDFALVGPTIDAVDARLWEGYPQAFTRIQRFEIGPSTKAKLEARLIGPDPDVLRDLGDAVIAIFESEPDAINVRHNWRERTKVYQPVLNEAEARRLGISRQDLDRALAMNTDGVRVGLYRWGSRLLPIILRPPESERDQVERLEDILVYSPVKQAYVNVGQLVLGNELIWEDALIKRRDRKRTLVVQADPVPGLMPSKLHARIRDAVEAVPLPPGYQLEWGGEYEAQQDANVAVFAFVPLGVLIMIVLTLVLFGSAKQALVVWITVPLSLIGVTVGLLVTGAPFSFMALLALLSLIGMQLKNGIVLVEEIKRLGQEQSDEQSDEQSKDWLPAIIEAAVSRVRPVTMAALTTILGMLPLLADVFFRPMAVTIMFGLGFATLLTLFVVPVLFALFYGVQYRPGEAIPSAAASGQTLTAGELPG